jgi:hypothetical protein
MQLTQTNLYDSITRQLKPQAFSHWQNVVIITYIPWTPEATGKVEYFIVSGFLDDMRVHR